MRRKTAVCVMLCLLLPCCALAQDSDLYVFNYTGDAMPGYEYSQKYYHPSPHYNDLKVDEDGDGVNETRWNYTGHKTMNMICPHEVNDGGEGPYASIPVYCLDAVTDGVHGYAYRRINLEESSYFDDQTAGRLRAILANVFPHVQNMEQMMENVNAWLASTDGTDCVPVQSLTETECITAAQSAIWVLTNGAEIVNPYLGTDSIRFRAQDCIRPEMLKQPATAHTAYNCAAVVRYLLALPAMPSPDPLISASSILNTAARFEQQDDGTWQAEIVARINANVHGRSRLTLHAECEGKTSPAVQVKDGENTYTLLLTGLPDASGEITLVMQGVQDAADVFLFDPLDGRHQSQTMGGFVDCAAPVRVRANVASTVFDPADPDENVPRTGDDTQPVLLGLLLAVSALSMAALNLRRYRR